MQLNLIHMKTVSAAYAAAGAVFAFIRILFSVSQMETAVQNLRNPYI